MKKEEERKRAASLSKIVTRMRGVDGGSTCEPAPLILKLKSYMIKEAQRQGFDVTGAFFLPERGPSPPSIYLKIVSYPDARPRRTHRWHGPFVYPHQKKTRAVIAHSNSIPGPPEQAINRVIWHSVVRVPSDSQGPDRPPTAKLVSTPSFLTRGSVSRVCLSAHIWVSTSIQLLRELAQTETGTNQRKIR